MIPFPYTVDYETEDTPKLQWEARDTHSTIVSSAGPFANDKDAARQLFNRRKAMVGHTIRLLRDGMEWEPEA